MSGWIKLYRRFLDWEYYAEPNTKAVAIHLLLKANREAKKWQGVTIDRGELAIGVESLGKDLGLTIQQTRTALAKLKKSEFCNIRSTNKFSIVTVLNFDSYQALDSDEQQTNNKRATNEQQTNNKRITTIQEIENIRIKEKEKSSHTHTCTHEDFLKFVLWIKDNAPSLEEFRYQFTELQFVKMKSRYDATTQIKPILEEMHNNGASSKKNSAYLTFKSYMRNAKQSNAKPRKKREYSYEQMLDLTVNKGLSMSLYEKQPNGMYTKK
ncbi:MAG: hypothetical protein SNH27_07460 [Rikenellaceae bacterium]